MRIVVFVCVGRRMCPITNFIVVNHNNDNYSINSSASNAEYNFLIQFRLLYFLYTEYSARQLVRQTSHVLFCCYTQNSGNNIINNRKTHDEKRL